MMASINQLQLAVEEKVVHLRIVQREQAGDLRDFIQGKLYFASLFSPIGDFREAELLCHVLLRKSKPCAGSLDFEWFHNVHPFLPIFF